MSVAQIQAVDDRNEIPPGGRAWSGANWATSGTGSKRRRKTPPGSGLVVVAGASKAQRNTCHQATFTRRRRGVVRPLGGAPASLDSGKRPARGIGLSGYERFSPLDAPPQPFPEVDSVPSDALDLG
jgi:hypothetical protein